MLLNYEDGKGFGIIWSINSVYLVFFNVQSKLPSGLLDLSFPFGVYKVRR